jgi:hypothetical protein
MQFIKIDDALGIGDTKDMAYGKLDRFFTCILVGVTGAGKTTLKSRLLERYKFYNLPDRRILTDKVILPMMQVDHGVPVDRNQRFTHTKAFREKYPGGMGYLLSKTRIKDIDPLTPVLFDGLRGVNEVAYAAKSIPSSFFIVLSAPEHIRIKRLLARGDSFDRIKGRITPRDVAGFKTICSPSQRKELFEYVEQKKIPENQLYEKVKIVLKERENYDQGAASSFIKKNLSDRAILIDSSKQSPGQIEATLHRQLHDKITIG